MTLIMDGLLLAAAAFAGTYCFVLARRVRALKDLDSGLGAAIVRMTRALEEARHALQAAKTASLDENKDLRDLITRAEAASGQLRILLAATRDLPQPQRPRESDAGPRRDPAATSLPTVRGEGPVGRQAARLEVPFKAAAPDFAPAPAEAAKASETLPRAAAEDDLISALAEFAASARR